MAGLLLDISTRRAMHICQGAQGQLMKHIFILAALIILQLFSIKVSDAGDLKTILDRQRSNFPSENSSTYCSAGSNIKVVDTSSPVTATYLDRLRKFGVEVVARYYGYTDTDLPPDGSVPTAFQIAKVIKSGEAELLSSNGMASIAVFQYHSQNEATFANWKVRAPADAKRA